jgi:hypothetical protein
MKRTTLSLGLLAWLAILMILPGSGVARASCEAGAAICAWTQRVVGIKTPNMIASGTLIGDGFVLTNRHVVEDHGSVLIRLPDGEITRAQPIPHDVPVDLVLLRLRGTDNPLPRRDDAFPGHSTILTVVGFDQGRNQPRAYEPSTFARHPDATVLPQARIHADARALPGNSGGAVLNAAGELVGILAAGDGEMSEIIPIQHLSALLARSDSAHEQAFLQQGGAIRRCADLLYDAGSIARDPSSDLVMALKTACLTSGNKMLFDQAGQKFGEWWMFQLSEMFLRESLKLDPDSPNSLMSLAVTYHLDRQMEKERPLLERYLDIDPQNPQALRLAVQVAGVLKDRLLADRVLALMEAHNPAALPLAREFIANAFAS